MFGGKFSADDLADTHGCIVTIGCHQRVKFFGQNLM